MRIPSVSQAAHLVRGFVKRESTNVKNFDMPWSRRLWLYRHGFASSRGELYDIDPTNVDTYLSDADWTKARSINQPYDRGLEVKPIFHRLVSETHAELLPDAYGIVRNGEFRRPPGFDSPVESISDLLTFAHDQAVVVKPVDGLMGNDVHVVEPGDGRLLVDGVPFRDGDVRQLLREIPESIVVERVEQTDYAKAVYPRTTNTLRLLTMIDPDTGEPFLAGTAHRFGTSASEPVDNWSAGGVFVDVDKETGAFGEFVASAKLGSAGKFHQHPETNASLDGTRVPGWDTIRERTLDLAAEFGWMWPCVGWDVVVTNDDGTMAIIEGNDHSGVTGIQMFEPLLSDDRVHRFYEHHGVV